MNNLQLRPQESKNIFNIPAPYNADIWHVCDWDYYKNADKKNQHAWIARSNVMNKTVDFTICKNSTVAEEIKYFFWELTNKISLKSFAEYMDRYKLLVNYVNEHLVSSVCEISLQDYENYIVSTGHKKEISNGKTICGNNIVAKTKLNKSISFVKQLQKSVWQYFESLKPLFDRDIWNSKEVYPTSNCSYGYLHFESIKQEAMKVAAKNYMKLRLNDISFKSAKRLLNSICNFTTWLQKEHPTIEHFSEINRDILESYFFYLRTNSGMSQSQINIFILNLHVFFDYGILSENPEFPQTKLFTNDDYAFKTKHKEKFYSDEDIQIIFKQLAPNLPKVYGKLFLFLLLTGVRINEALHLTEESICEVNGKYYLSIYMTKTQKYNHIPINETVLNLLNAEIENNKKSFPTAKYIFLNNQGNCICFSTFTYKIRTAIVKNNIKGTDGELFEFKSHRFRATKATKLINMGVNPNTAADMLGQSTLSALSYYAVATGEELQKEMQTYLKKQSILINNIGKIDSLVIEDYKNAIPLCNGWCCRPTELGVCDKIEACLSCPSFKPSTKYLLNYKLQLQDTEASLQIAETNGYTKMADKCKQQIEYLKSIIEKLEEKQNE